MVASPGGAGRNRVLNKTEFLKIPVNVPEAKEQKKIADAISSIDDVITLVEKEVVLWEEKKKGVMQKIFSQEVRFKKEDGSVYPEWDNGKLSNLCTYHQGLTYSPLDVSDDGFIVLRSSNIQSDVICYDDVVRVNLELKEELLVRENDVFNLCEKWEQTFSGKDSNYKRKRFGMLLGSFYDDYS